MNLIAIDKQPHLQYLSIDEAAEHCGKGAGVWPWAGNDHGSEDPDMVLACAGDVATAEMVAAAQLLKPSGSRTCPPAWSTSWTS